MAKQARTFSLAATLTAAFSVLSIPMLILVMSISYLRNTDSIQDIIEQHAHQSRSLSIKATKLFIEPVRHITEVVAAVAAENLELFKRDEGDDILFRALNSANRIDSIYITFADGSAHGVTRIDAGRRLSEPAIPAGAKWHVHTRSPLVEGVQSTRREEFFSDWRTKIFEINSPAEFDSRTAPNYIGAKASGATFVARPGVNPATGVPVVSIGAPIIVRGEFQGVIGSNITLEQLSVFLTENRSSPKTLAAVIDDAGTLIAHSDVKLAAAERSLSTDLGTIRASVEQRVRKIIANNNPDSSEVVSFDTTIEGTECSVVVFKLLNDFGLDWNALVVTPVAEYAAPLETTNTILLVLLAILIPLELLLIARMSRTLAGEISAIAAELDTIRAMELRGESGPVLPSRVREVSHLQTGFSLLKRALHSFSQYVPIDVVKGLTRSGESIALGVEPRELTIMFCDLENFSTAAQELSPDQLLEHVSAYFAVATAAVTRTGGTVDKFIGDAVMAFWNAPVACPDHPRRACEAALEIMAGLERLNSEWLAAGKRPLKARVGINTARVLVGNIGTPERLSYTALGDGVNVAARLQAINKEFGTSVCISDETYARVGDDVITRPLRPVSVKGRNGEFMIYELIGVKTR